MQIEYQPPKKRQPVFACFKGLLRIFIRKVRVVSVGGEPDEHCLYLANHANKMQYVFQALPRKVGSKPYARKL